MTKRIFTSLKTLTLGLFLLGCSNGEMKSDTFTSSYCTPHYLNALAISNWSIFKLDGLYTIQGTIDRANLNLLKASSPTCSVSRYEMSIVDGDQYIVFKTDSQPSIIKAWSTIGSADSFNYTSLSLIPGNKVSVCFRAFSNLSEESSWYCSSGTVPTITDTTPNPSPTPVDTTPPSTPGNLALTLPNWSYGSTLFLNFGASNDAQSGIARYWTSILDSSMNQITLDKEVSKYATSDSFNAQDLIGGRYYNYAIVAENGAGLYSSIATKQFYKPVQVTVYIKYYSMGTGGCNYPTTYSCQSAVKTMFDTQLASLKSSQYPTCALSPLGANTYELNCRPAQTCKVNPIGGYCNGVPATQYSGYCTAVHGVGTSGSCGSSTWSPTIPFF